jgi:hypothetical protein
MRCECDGFAKFECECDSFVKSECEFGEIFLKISHKFAFCECENATDIFTMRMWRISIITMRMRCKSEFVALHSHFFAKCEFTFPVVPTYSRGGYFDIENFLRPNLCRNLQNDISGINLAWKLHFENFWINSRICCCYLQFFIFASCIFCKSMQRLLTICKIKILHFAFFKYDFY